MSVPQEPDNANQRTYVIDSESEAEMARLLRQEQLLTRGMGGVFPEKPDLTHVQRVIDLACGPGGWALEVAFTYSDIEVIGVDISERMISYAQALAEAQQRKNVSFHTMDILKPLDFPEASFDLVNARLISGFMLREQWPIFFHECLRILRPGGILRLTEVEGGLVNKPHVEKIAQLSMRAMNLAGMNFSPNGLYYGILHVLPRFFQQAGLHKIDKMAHFIDFSFGTEAHEGYYHNAALMMPLLEPLITKMQLATAEEWHDLMQRGLAEIYEEDFCTAWLMLTIWGQKPAE